MQGGLAARVSQKVKQETMKYMEIWWSTWNHSLSTPFCYCSDCLLQGAPSCFSGGGTGDPSAMQAEHDMDNLRPVDVLSKGERDRVCETFIINAHHWSWCIMTCHHLSSIHVALNVLPSLNVERWWHETIFSGIWLNHHRDAKSLRLQVELELNQTCVSSSVSHLFHWNFQSLNLDLQPCELVYIGGHCQTTYGAQRKLSSSELHVTQLILRNII